LADHSRGGVTIEGALERIGTGGERHSSGGFGNGARDLDLELRRRDRECVLRAALFVKGDGERTRRRVDRLDIETERIERVHVDLAAAGRLGFAAPTAATTAGGQEKPGREQGGEWHASLAATGHRGPPRTPSSHGSSRGT